MDSGFLTDMNRFCSLTKIKHLLPTLRELHPDSEAWGRRVILIILGLLRGLRVATFFPL